MRKLLGVATLLPILLWGIVVLYVGSLTMTAVSLPKIPEYFRLSNTIFYLLCFHVTWCIGTLQQTILAFSISDEVLDEYVSRAIVKNRFVFYFLVVDAIYFIWYFVTYRNILWN